jgi:hypothetical protein
MRNESGGFGIEQRTQVMMLLYLIMGMAIYAGIEWLYPSHDDTHRFRMFVCLCLCTVGAGILAKLWLQ